ncbi:type IV secretion system protein [Qipengyuania nanhaisediminis]|uniref:type IV secretion system protein n=1 Tax=Qipengyuania nanhaisediminis TaxID=604088 RepID=UPI0038B268C7
MTTSCDLVAQDMGTGVAAALTAVDCIAGQVSEQAFERLFGAEGELGTVLTVLLTFYVVFFGIGLMLGRSNLSVRALIPKMMTIGLVLTFATSFAAFQTVFYNLVISGPNAIAGILTDSPGAATATFASKLDVVFVAVQEAGGQGGAQGGAPGAAQDNISAFTPAGMMWIGAMLLLLGTVGLLVTARIGLALLLAVGPVFVVLALFNGTRGLFAGWLKGLVMLALAPLFAVVGGSIMLELAVPILAALVAVPGQIDQQAAMAFFLVGAVHVALMFMVLKVAASMVAGWEVFGLASPDKADDSSPAPAVHDKAREQAARDAGAAGLATVLAAHGAARSGGQATARSPAQPGAANDPGEGTAHGQRAVRVYATRPSGVLPQPQSPAASRTQGIGNRFRAPAARQSIPRETRS